MLLVLIIILLTVFEYFTNKSTTYKNIISELLIIFALLLAGFSIVKMKDSTLNKSHYLNYSNLFNQESKMIVKINSPVKITNKKVTIKGELINFFSDSLIYPVIGKILLFIPLDSNSINLLPGDFICFKAHLQKFKSLGNPHEFDYSKHLKSKGILAQSFVNNHSNWFIYKSISTLKRYSTIIRNYCIEIFKKSGLISNNLAIASALTFGYKDDLSTYVKGVFSKTGAMHVLAVSGLHVGIIYLIINSILKLFKLPFRFKWINDIIILLVIWFYALTTGLSPSILRASTMLSFLTFANVFNKSTNIFNIIFSSAFFLLLVDPFLILDVGFQLSYLAVFGIISIYPVIYKIIVFNNFFLEKVWAISAVSIAAQIATFPISIYYFHQFPNLFLLSNIIVIPLVFTIFILGIGTIALSFNHSLLFFIGKIHSFFLTILLSKLTLINNISFSNSKGLFISKWETLLLYLSIVSILLFFNYKYVFLQKIFITILFFIISLDIIEDIGLKSQKKIIVYNIPNHTAVDLISGNKHHFIADHKLLKNKEKIQFFVENNWNFLDLSHPNILSLNDFNFSTIKWEGKTISFVNENWIYNKDIDIAIINEKPKNSNQLFKNAKIAKIIQNKSGFQSNDLINQDLINNNNSVNDVTVKGAYIYNVNLENAKN